MYTHKLSWECLSTEGRKKWPDLRGWRDHLCQCRQWEQPGKEKLMIILTSLLLQVEELKEKRNRTGSTTKSSYTCSD